MPRPSALLPLAIAAGLVLATTAGQQAAGADPVRAAHGMVGSSEVHATQTGIDILKAGGNAVDAAVATGFALAVTHPEAGNIGGGGFMVIRLASGKETTIDFREKAPARATRDMFLDEHGNAVDERSRLGSLACGVPGSVAGLALAEREYGRLSLARVMAPAIALARDGFVVSKSLADSFERAQPRLSKFPSSLKAFYKPDGSALHEGDRLVQPDLARTLSLIAEAGPGAFYRGAIAELVAREMDASGGLITKADLAAYQPAERTPVAGSYHGYRVVSMAPPSSGGVGLLELLNILEPYPLAQYGPNTARTMHLMIEAERRVYADRAEWLGDPEFVKVPVAGLISKSYAARLRASIDESHATPSADVRAGAPRDFEPAETTHYSVVDADGNAVATTTTLNGGFGNAQTVAGAGFLLNNEMDDFSARPNSPNMFGLLGGEANAVAGGKRMLSSMTPTIVTRDGRTVLVLGSPGGSHIITTVLQVLLNVVDFKMNVQQAVALPRFHHQWSPDVVMIEADGFAPGVLGALTALGHTTEVVSPMGEVHAIAIDPDSGERTGASDPRADGVTIGY